MTRIDSQYIPLKVKHIALLVKSPMLPTMLEIKKFKWVEGASPLKHFKIYKYIGPTILGKQADVELIYKNSKSVRMYGDQMEVFDEALRRINKKTNQVEKKIFADSFMDSWSHATIYGYSEYKKLSGNKNPIATLDPLKSWIKSTNLKELSKRTIDSLDQIKSMNDLLADNFYKQINPAKLIHSKLSEKGWDKKNLADKMQKLGRDERQKQSTTYTHLSGERAVSRDVAIEYSKILDCDPVDLMFPKKTTVVWGKVNTKKGVETYKPFVPGEIYPYTTQDKDMERVIVPRDIWKKNIKAVKVDARGTIFDQHVAFYYFSNSKDESCMNKLCVVGAIVHPHAIDPDYTETNYYLGLYENNQGTSNLINADPFVSEKNKYILKDFEPNFISPVVCIINPQSIIDETIKQSVIPESEYRKEEMLISELHKVREQLKEAKQTSEKTTQTQKQTEQMQKDTARIQATADKIMSDVTAMQERLLQAEQQAFLNKMQEQEKSSKNNLKIVKAK